MRTMLVVVTTPFTDDGSGVSQAGKPVIVQALVPKLTVEAFDVSVLRGLAGLDELQGDAVGICPLVERLAGEFRTLVGADGLRVSPK